MREANEGVERNGSLSNAMSEDVIACLLRRYTLRSVKSIVACTVK